MSEYADESAALDADIELMIEAWHTMRIAPDEGAFNHLALRIFAYQLRYNAPLAAYCATLGFSTAKLPGHWTEIPPVPSAAFKDATLATFDVAHAALRFETSGTTQGRGGMHYMETRTLYEHALLAAFDRAMLYDGARLRYLNVVPNPADRPQSSLGFMMAWVSTHRGDGNTGWYVRGEELFAHAFIEDARAAIEDGAAACIAGTAFGLLQLLDTLVQQNIQLALPPGSRVMETGGFKGRSRTTSREELYAQLTDRLGIPTHAIVAEYGMTELTSQYYDTLESRTQLARIKAGPPWLRTRIVDERGADVPDGIVGSLVHVDLANRSSAIAVATEDLGARAGGGFVLLGREESASLRGCSLDAETLQVKAIDR